MADKQYVYAVARIRSKELSLLSGAFLDQLTAAKDYDECIQLLMEKGWGDDSTASAEALLALGLYSAIKQGKAAVASIGLVAKKPDQFGKAMIFPAMVETYAILALLISILAIFGIAGVNA